MSSVSTRSATFALERGVVIWPQVACRTTEAVIACLADKFAGGVTVVLTDNGQSRREMGWAAPRFDNCDVVRVRPGDYEASVALVRRRSKSLHVIGSWRRPALLREVAVACAANQTPYGFWSEAPLSRYHSPAGAFAYRAWIRLCANAARTIIRSARFFINSSGSSCSTLVETGWDPSIIYPFGYFPAARQVEARAITDTKLRMVSLGHLRPGRGTEDALKAMRMLSDRGIELELDVVGDGPMRTELEKLARRLRLSQLVKFHGFISDDAVDQILSRTSIMLCTGCAEPWGVRVNEGLAAGFVVVVSDRIGASEVLARNGAGVLYRPKDVSSMAVALECLARSPRAGRSMQLRARVAGASLAPEQAAAYMLAVIRHAFGLDDRRPSPPWLWPVT